MTTYIVVFRVGWFSDPREAAEKIEGNSYLNIEAVQRAFPKAETYTLYEWMDLYNDGEIEEEVTFISYVHTE